MKKILSVLLILLLAASLLTACKKEEESHQRPASSQAATETETLGEDEDDGVVAYTAPAASENGASSADSGLASSSSVLNVLLCFTQTPEDSAAKNSALYWGFDHYILLSLDASHHKIKYTYLQGDSYLTLPEYGSNKLRAAYDLGGEELVISTIESNFGIKIDKYQTLDMKNFPAVIDSLGGLDMELDQEEIKYINAEIDANGLTNKTTLLKIDDKKDRQTVHLDGTQAQFYFLDRGADSIGSNPEYSFSGDSWDRGERQVKLLQAIVTTFAAKSDLTDYTAWVNSAASLTDTNLKKSDTNFLLENSGEYLRYEQASLMTPTQDHWIYAQTDDGISIIKITDLNAVKIDILVFIYEELTEG